MPSIFFFKRAFSFSFLSKDNGKKNDSAVSPVIGVVLMVGITVILAAVISVFAFSFGGMNAKGPTASIQVSNNALTNNIYDLKIVHSGGERIRAGDWRISIVKVPDKPVFVTSSSDLSVGDQIITTNLTNSGNITVTNKAITVDGAAANFEPETKYDVKIIVFPYKTITVDAVVYIR